MQAKWKTSPRFWILSLIFLLALTGCRSAVLEITAAPLPTVTPIISNRTPDPIRVTVDGAVRQPGSYTLLAGSLVEAAVRAAGGPITDADLSRINLARVLEDGHHVHVPLAGEVLPTATPYGLSIDGRIDINRAGASLLETLPKIGPVTAQNIITYREMQGPFETVEQIQEVKGIGPATFENIKGLITAEE